MLHTESHCSSDQQQIAVTGNCYVTPEAGQLKSAHTAGSTPAIGHTPSGVQQIISSTMSIPLFPGMPMGAMHMGPEGPLPNMPGHAPAANGPVPASGPAASTPAGASRATAGNRAPGSGAAPASGGAAGAAAGAGAAQGAGQGMGLNQAFAQMLQSALSGAAPQPNRPASGVAFENHHMLILIAHSMSLY